jgi:hypothetical protein
MRVKEINMKILEKFKKLLSGFMVFLLFMQMSIMGAMPVMAATIVTSSYFPTVTTNTTGVGSSDWSNSDGIKDSGGLNYATNNIPSGASTRFLKGTHYDFNIPAGATINGIQVAIRRKASGSNVKDNVVKLVKNNGIVGDNKAYSGSDSNWPTSNISTRGYGSSSDLWNETWSLADINNDNFGVVLSAENTDEDANRVASVDYMTIVITYTEADTTSPNMGAITAKITSTGTTISASTWQSDNDPYFSWSAPSDPSTPLKYWYAIDDNTPETNNSYVCPISRRLIIWRQAYILCKS